MMRAMQNAMRLQALRQSSGIRQTSVGEITSYDPQSFAVRVQLQAEEILTGWLPLCSPWIGNSWGMFAAPSIGDMVAVQFFGGDLESGFVEARLYNDVDVPLAVPSAEFWLVHKSGSFLKFTNDGDILVNTERDLTATIGRNLTATVAGDISVSCRGNAGVTVQGNATAVVNGAASLTVDGNATVDVGGDATATVSGALAVTAPTATVTAETTIDGNVTITENLTVGGAINSTGDIVSAADVADQGGAKTMASMRTAHNQHKGHGDPGTGNTPDHLM